MRAGAPRRNEDREPRVPKTFKLEYSLALAVIAEARARNVDQSDVAREALRAFPPLRNRLKRARVA
jgi:hypothetical protein